MRSIQSELKRLGGGGLTAGLLTQPLQGYAFLSSRIVLYPLFKEANYCYLPYIDLS